MLLTNRVAKNYKKQIFLSDEAPSSSIEEDEPHRPVTVQSLLLSMADQPGRSLESQRRFHENFANFFNSRRVRATARRQLCNINESDNSEINSMEEIPLPPNRFQNAIYDLPLPKAVKQFLLFYRTPN